MDKNKKKSNDLGIKASRKAAIDFLRAGRRNELKKEGGFALHDRFSKMSDEDFDREVAEGKITPEQIREAGEWAWDTYMGDVWMENPDNDDVPQPSYEEFMTDPAKYGYDASQHDYEGARYPDRFYRYKPGRYDKVAGSADRSVEALADRDTLERVKKWDRDNATNAAAAKESAPVPSDNTAVAKKPIPQQ